MFGKVGTRRPEEFPEAPRGFWMFLGASSEGSREPLEAVLRLLGSLKTFSSGPKSAQNGSPDPSRGPSVAVFHPGSILGGPGAQKRSPGRQKSRKNSGDIFSNRPLRPPERGAASGDLWRPLGFTRGPAKVLAPPKPPQAQQGSETVLLRLWQISCMGGGWPGESPKEIRTSCKSKPARALVWLCAV